MKNLIKTSLVAVLVAAPMVASAGLPTGVTYSNGQTTKTDITANSAVATTSYVQGAYDAAIDAVSAENTRATTVEGDIANLTGFGANAPTNLVAAINAAKAAADAASSNSNTALGTISEGNHNYISGGNTTVSANLESLDTAVKTNETHIGDLSTLDSSFTEAQKASATTAIAAVDGRVDTLEGTMGDVALSGFTADTVKGALNELKTAQTTAGTNSTVADGNYIRNSNTVAQNLTALDTAVDGVSDKIGAKANGNYITGTDTVAQDLTTLDTAVKANADAIRSIEAATLTVYDTWGGNHTSTVDLFTTTSGQGNSVTEPAADTVRTPAQQQQTCSTSQYWYAPSNTCVACGTGATSLGGTATTCSCAEGYTWNAESGTEGSCTPNS